MMANCKEDGKQCRGKEMEGVGEGLKTLECLRGRLLVERQSSRSAKEEAEFMVEKLIELENQIRKEIALRNKAEKRLKLLMKKLQSLKITTSLSVSSENSNSSEISTNSSAPTKETKEQELKSEKLPEITISKQEKNRQNILNQANASPNSNPIYELPKSSRTDPHQISQIIQSKDQSFSVKANEREQKDYKENLLTLVAGAGTLPAANPKAGVMKLNPGREKVMEVIDGLKLIGENNRSSFQRRHHMEVIMSM